jgi:hypothetical protein
MPTELLAKDAEFVPLWEAAALAKRSERSIVRRIRCGQLATIREGHRVLVSRHDLEALLRRLERR